MVFDSRKLGKYLRTMRLAKGYSQASVARCLGYSSSQFISNWERGISTPPLKVLPALVDMYGLNRNELVEVIVEEVKENIEAAVR